MTQTLIDLFARLILNPLMLLLFAAGFLLFIVGLIEFLWELRKGSHEAEHGKDHMLWGIFGMFVMSSAYAIIKLLGSMVGQNIR